MSDPSGPARELSARLGRLLMRMRSDGVRVGVGELLQAHRALAALAGCRREDARLALRAVLCARRADFDAFERAFAAEFTESGGPPAGSEALESLGTVERVALPHAAFGEGAPPGTQEPRVPPRPVPAAWSAVELIAEKDFADYSDEELTLARELIAQLARRTPMRRSRRRRPTHGRGDVVDLRASIRASLSWGGEPMQWRWRIDTRRPRPLVLVCDVSGSMAPYARMLLQYVHACVAARSRVEAFAFGTRLTRITHELGGRDHDRSLRWTADAVVDLSGGTRIGAALADLNRAHGRRIGRGAVVVILSDGWDRGEPELLSAEMARLRRSAYRLVWCNPLSAHPDYAPLTRGMQAAIPHTDRLLAGNSIASLRRLGETLEAL